MQSVWIASCVLSMVLPMISAKLLEEKEVICTSEKLIVNLAFSDPFNGVVFAQDQYTNPRCKWLGNGGRFLLIVVSMNENQSTLFSDTTPDGCGIQYDQINEEHSIVIIVSPDPLVLTEESFALNIKCVHSTLDLMLTLAAPSLDPIKISSTDPLTVFGSSMHSPQLKLSVLEGHGVSGKNVTQASVGQRLTLDIALQDTFIYDMFVHNCIAHDGSRDPDATVNIIDSSGCAVGLRRAIDAPVFVTAPQVNFTKHTYIYIYGFQFTSSSKVFFECSITPCIFECQKKQCDSNPVTFSPPYQSQPQRGTELSLVKIQQTMEIVPPRMSRDLDQEFYE